MLAELGVELADLLDGVAHATLRRDACAFRSGACAAHLAAQPDGTRQLLDQRLVFIAGALDLRDVTARLGLLDRIGERRDALPVLRARLVIE